METEQTQSLQEFIDDLTRPEPFGFNTVDEAAPSRILGPLADTGCVVEIDAETYSWYSAVFPQHFWRPSCFCFAEGFEPFRLFFRKSGRCFTRRLTWNETRTFCRLADIPFPGF
jgi:hypothetical protein